VPRLAPKVTVAITTIIATAAPMMAERMGTVSAWRLDSSASRMPATADVGRPAALAPPATADGRDAAFGFAAIRCGARRYASTTLMVLSAATNAAAPIASTVQSAANPSDGYTGRTGPIGHSGDMAIATAHASSAPTTTESDTPRRPSVDVTALPAPSARSVWSSFSSSRSWRPIA